VSRIVRRILASVAILALVAGCSGGSAVGGSTPAPGPVTTDVCLGERGFALRPAASGVSAIAPSGVEFTIAFFSTAGEASEAAGRAEGSTAVANAVVAPTGELTAADMKTIEECVRGG
jgi:hypothetical protein